MRAVPRVRHLVRARDLVDARYFEPLHVDDLARAAGLSRAHFSGEFRRVFGESPHSYLLTRRLERAAALLRTTDRSVAEICVCVGLRSVGSFTTSFTPHTGCRPSSTVGASRRPPRTRSCRAASYGPTGARNTGRFEKTARRGRLSIGDR
jgi:AraC-like DNA-binding protein